MSSSVISVENLSKYYKLGLIGGGTLREDVSRWAAKLRGEPDPAIPVGTQAHHNRKGGEIWALRDINLEVKEGEILGIIGRNGAGKSTLLKILSRITAPTSGRAIIWGRVGSLLEVGTGFHPELTGRENIFLNGAILGMTKAEVARKLDEIVEFAEIRKFIDTPVKRYSSGMTVRLAFAVAAHLEPEILVVDEVLAVGDVEFQKKCLGKMKDVSQLGRTVLFVSHNMGTINALCNRCVILKDGEVECSGSTKDMVAMYMEKDSSGDKYVSVRKSYGKPQIGSIEVENNNDGSGEVVLRIFIESHEAMLCSIDFRLLDNFGTPVAYGSLGALDTSRLIRLNSGLNDYRVMLSLSRIANGTYRLSVDLTNPGFDYYDKVEDEIVLKVNRMPDREGVRILDQQWGKGFVELDTILIK